MKRFLTVALMGVLALGLSSAVYANVCSFDAVPAATLLFPFVPYDYEGGTDGQTTLFSITNVSYEAQIVHVTVWTDYSVAILDFNVLLTGYDVITMNIRDIMEGTLPGILTGDTLWEDDNAGDPPFADGPVSDINEVFDPLLNFQFDLTNPQATEPALSATCDPVDTTVPTPENYTQIPASIVSTFEGYVKASQGGANVYRNCDDSEDVVIDPETWFTSRVSGPAWMYITADVVNTCNKDLPDSDGLAYFSPATISYDNVLVGDQIWMDAAKNFSEADNAVHLEADTLIDTTDSDSGYETTFYHRYTLDATGVQPNSDFREPLPTAWHMRYQLSPPYEINTWIRAWKGGTESRYADDLLNITGPGPTSIEASTCRAYTYYAWDMDENCNSVTSDEYPWSGGPEDPVRPVPNLFPLETQEVEANQLFLVEDEDVPGDYFGWLLFVWPRSNTENLEAQTQYDADQYQTWMGVKYSGFGNYTAAMSGAVMANYNCDAREVLPALYSAQWAQEPAR